MTSIRLSFAGGLAGLAITTAGCAELSLILRGDDPCIAKCERSPECAYDDPEEYMDYDEARAAWDAQEGCPKDNRWHDAIVGECAGGERFLQGWDREGSEKRYFDADGNFVALEWTTDFDNAPPCYRTYYWPFRFECDGAIVTETICESRSQIEQPPATTVDGDLPSEDVDPCIAKCEFSPECCYDNPEQYMDYDEARAAWDAQEGCPKDARWHNVLAGECASGERFLFVIDPFGSEMRYFDAEGNFIAVKWTTDYNNHAPCGLTHYWPFRFECDGAVYTEAICGTRFPIEEPAARPEP